jgi:hypothetical protein
MGMFRELKAEEIEVRVSRVTNAGVELLLYKTSRTDSDILDETVGPENWQCSYESINGELFCTVSIWSEERGQWVSKQDVGSPSNVEAEKGRASDGLKRCCSRWGIGRSLYSAPRIFVYADKCGKIQQGKNGKMQCYDRFHVEKVRIEDGQITGLSIWNDTTEHRCFVWQKGE